MSTKKWMVCVVAAALSFALAAAPMATSALRSWMVSRIRMKAPKVPMRNGIGGTGMK